LILCDGLTDPDFRIEIEAVAAFDSQAVYLMMSTNYGDQGLVNARALAEVLGVRLGQPQLL